MAKQIVSGQGQENPTAPNAEQQAPKVETKKAPIKIELKRIRKKPVVVKGFQWFPELGAVGGVILKPISTEEGSPSKFVIETLEGDHDVTPGDWIITGVKGEKYPCKADIFTMSYDEVKETEIADPTGALPDAVERNMTWIIARFSNGDTFKIAAKYVANKMVKEAAEKGDRLDFSFAMRSPAALVKYASEKIGWNELSQVAIGYQAPEMSDRPAEWATAFKTVEIEPESKPEKKFVPPPSDIKTAKQEDAEEAEKKLKGGKDEEDDNDPETWKD